MLCQFLGTNDSHWEQGQVDKTGVDTFDPIFLQSIHCNLTGVNWSIVLLPKNTVAMFAVVFIFP